jgi:adhesin transport system outer membrane protein
MMNRSPRLKFALLTLSMSLMVLVPGRGAFGADETKAPLASTPEATVQKTDAQAAGAQKSGAVEPSVKVTLRDSIAELFRTHDRIKSAESAVSSATHMHDRARGAWYPRLNAVVDGGHEDIRKPTDPASTSKWRNVQTLSASQTVYDFGGTTGGINQADGIRKESLAKLDMIRQEVSLQGVSSYLGLIRTREMLRYAIRSEENIKRLSGMQEALVERGVGLSYEELQIKAQLSQSQAHRINIERAYTNARNNYKSVYGVDLTEAQIDSLILPALPQKNMPPTLDDAVAKALDGSPALIELQQALETKKGDLEVRESAMYPKVEAVAETTRKENDQGDAGIRSEQRYGLQVSYNLFSGYRDVDNIRAAKSDITSVRKSLLDRRRTVEERVRNAWNDILTLKKTIALYENQANITWAYLELVKKKKAMGGEVGITEIITGERDYINATSSKVTSEIEHITAAYMLLNQMGLITPDIVEN